MEMTQEQTLPTKMEELMSTAATQTDKDIELLLEGDLGDFMLPEFVIQDVESANRLVARYNRIKAEAKQINEEIDASIARYTEKAEVLRESKMSQLNFQLSHLEGILVAWANSQLKDSKKRSVKLVEGTIGFRSSTPSLEITDEEAIIRVLPDVYLNKTVRKGDLKKVVAIDEKTGIVTMEKKQLPGIVGVKKPDSFYVKAS